MNCIHCGKKIEDNQDYCIHCGMYQNKKKQINIHENNRIYNPSPKINSVIFVVTIFFMILIGFFSGLAGDPIGNILFYTGFVLLLLFGIGWAIKFVIHDIKRFINGINRK